MELSLTAEGIKPRKSKGAADRKVVKTMVTADEAFKLLGDKLASRYAKVKDAFVRMDYDHTGLISATEFRVTLDLIGLRMSDAEFKKLWERFDRFGHGRINYAEFNNKIGRLIHPPAEPLLRDRPETPKIKEWRLKSIGKALRKKVRNLRRAFDEYDTDGSGLISHAEFIQALRKLGIQKVGDEESWQMMQKHRSPDNDTGDMTWEEFEKTMREYMKIPDKIAKKEDEEGGEEEEEGGSKWGARRLAPKMQLVNAEKMIADKLYGKYGTVQKVFRQFDKDHSGDLDAKEFKEALRTMGVNLSRRDWQGLMAKYDSSGDGTITYAEFNRQVGPLLHPSMNNVDAGFVGMDEQAAEERLADEFAMTVDPDARLQPNPALRARQAKQAELVSPALGLNKAEAILAQQLYGKKPQLKRVFQLLDKDRSGALSLGEFENAIAQFGLQLGRGELEMLLAKYDSSGDREISWGEFIDSVGDFLVKNPKNDRHLGIDLMDKEDEKDSQVAKMMEVESQVEVQPRRKERGEHKAPTGGGTPLPRTMGFDEEESKSNGGGAGGLMASSPIRRVTRSSQGSRGGGGSRRGSRAGGMGSGMGMGMLQDRPRSAASGGFRPGSRQSQRVGMGMGAGGMGDEDVRSVVSRASRGRARRAAGSPVGASMGMGMGMGVTGAVPAGMAADPANGHVRAVRAGTHRRKTQVMADGRTVSSVDLEATEEKMRRILGRSWQGIYHDVRRVGAGHGHGHGQGSSPLRASGGARGGVMGSPSGGGGAFGGTSLRFGGGGAVPQTHGVDSGVLRDILAKRGVPMTTGEMKRLERRFPSRQGSRARSGVGMGASASSRGAKGGFGGAGAGAGTAGEGEIDYHAMLARTFSRSGGRRR